MSKLRGLNQRLLCRVESGRLVISIGLNTLAFCAEHSPDVENAFMRDEGTDEYDRSRFKVTERDVFAKEIVSALLSEEEDGSTPLTNLIDKATMDAIEDGCQGVFIKEWE